MITRRDFLKVTGVAAAAAALTACGGSSSTASSAASSTAASSEAASAVAKLDKVKVAVPNDTTNEARALLLLEQEGLITLKEDAGLEATPNDIADNPKNLEFQEMEAAMLPQTIDEVDFSIINSNYALDAGLNPMTDALATEDPESDAAQAYANIIAVKEGNENNEAIKALVAALQSDEMREFIETTYNGSVVPMF